MNLKQRLLKKLYPVVMRLGNASGGNGTLLRNAKGTKPQVPFHELKGIQNNGEALDFYKLKNKKVLVVNTASNCGYTGQYAELQKLHESLKDNLVILGFPANDFKEQEKSDDNAIAEFCQLNYGVSFPLIKKSSVIKGNNQHPVYKWLTQAELNGWNSHQPDWNFSKFLINEEGVLTHYFGPSISPLSPQVAAAIKK